MKKSPLLLIAFFIAVFSGYSQNSKGVATTDEVGKFAFNILKNLDNTSEEEFINSLFTIEELKEFLNRHKDSFNTIKEQISGMEDGAYHKRVAGAFNDMRDRAKQFNIVLKDIEYSDFTFEKKTDDGLTGVQGKLLFKYKEKEYQIQVAALLLDNQYNTLIIRKLREKRE